MHYLRTSNTVHTKLEPTIVTIVTIGLVPKYMNDASTGARESMTLTNHRED